MPPAIQVLSPRAHGRTGIRDFSSWVLCALLLIFCGNARLARYSRGRSNLKLATAQSYLDGDETRLELTLAALLLLWSVAVVPVLRVTANRGAVVMAAVCGFPHYYSGEFNRESHLRPPPLR